MCVELNRLGEVEGLEQEKLSIVGGEPDKSSSQTKVGSFEQMQ